MPVTRILFPGKWWGSGPRRQKLEVGRNNSEERRPKTSDEQGAVRQRGQRGRDRDWRTRRRDHRNGGGATSRQGLRSRLPDRSDSTTENVLKDTIARHQMEVEAMMCGTPGHRTMDRPTSPVRMKPVVFTSTRVPMFTGLTSWEQYHRVA